MIVCIGDILLDVFFLPHLQAEEQSSGLLARGGGSAANTAAWLQWSGVPALMIGCVGDDLLGRALVEELDAAGVATRVRRVAKMETGLVAIEVSERGERTMRSSRGANSALAPEDLRDLPPHIDWVHLTGYSLLPPNDLGLLDAAAELARTHDVPFSFDPSSVSVIRTLGQPLIDALSRIPDLVLLPNWEEAATLGGTKWDAVVSGLGRAAVKRGESGSVALEGDRAVEVPAVVRRAIDTTGAGDAFNAGAIRALVREHSLEEACRTGNELAGQAVERYGGRPPRRG